MEYFRAAVDPGHRFKRLDAGLSRAKPADGKWFFPDSSAARAFSIIRRSSPLSRKRADAALDRLGVPHLADRPVAEMSSGEAKRILDRAGAGSRSANAGVRRTEQQPGCFRAARPPGSHARAGPVRNRHRSGDAPSLRRHPGNRSRCFNAQRKNSGGWPQGRLAGAGTNFTASSEFAWRSRGATATTICGDVAIRVYTE